MNERARFAAVVIVGALLLWPGWAWAAASARVAFEERLSEPPVLAAALDGGRAPGFPVLARITVARRDIETAPGAAPQLDALEQRLALYQARKVPVWLALDVSSDAHGRETAQAWTRLLRALAPRLVGRVEVFELVVPQATPSDAESIILASKVAAVELRAVNPQLAIALGAAHQRTVADLERAYTVDVASYLDAVVVSPESAPPAAAAPGGTSAPASSITVDSARRLLDSVDRSAAVFERSALLRSTPDAGARAGGTSGTATSGAASTGVGATTGTDTAARIARAGRAFVAAEVWRLGSASVRVSYDAPPAVVRAALAQAVPVEDLLAGDLTRLDHETTKASVTRDDGVPRRFSLLYNLSTFATYLVYADEPRATGEVASAVPSVVPPGVSPVAAASRGTSARVSLNIATDAKPRVRDPLARAGESRDTVGQFSRDRDTQHSSFNVPLAPTPLIVDFNDALGDVVTERNEVTGRDTLSVGEIIARHQQARAAQDAIVRHYTASARMEQHFRPSIADPGYDVVTENRFYVDGDGVEWEELSFSVNGSTWKENRPPFPLLQPEKVLSVPLTLRMSDDYRYRLDGIARVDRRDCYVVQFEPSSRERSLYRGTVWIDTATFVQRKLQAVQTKLAAPVVSNEEIHTFTVVATIDGRDVILPTRMTAKQIVLVAGRNLLVEKDTTFHDHQVNDGDFSERRQIARAGSRIMYRDTDNGVRYYVKDPDAPGGRVVSNRATTSVKAMAMGVTLDPSFDFPLPIFGINYLDFDFGGPDSQLALLFGGVLALGNVQRPKLLGTPLDGSVDFFAIAVPGSDRIYDESGEREAERVLTWPLSTGVNIGYQFTSFQKLVAQYQFRFDGYVRDRTTSEEYQLPRTTTTHGMGMTYEYRRAGYSVSANGTWYGRARWGPWGNPEALETSDRTYEKYSLNVSKDWFFGLFHKVHVNGAWFGGRRLDRFSQYQFGLFDDTRIHGVPASGVRMSELAMTRGSYSFNIFEQYRFDLFVEQAFGVDRRRETGWEPITGVGAALNVKGPWNTILRVDGGKSFLPSRYRTNGSTVIQILLLKPLS